MKVVENEGGERVTIQGFRGNPDGPYKYPSYVYLEVDDGDGPVAVSLSTRQANELGEYLRQEAEFAGSAREEGK